MQITTTKMADQLDQNMNPVQAVAKLFDAVQAGDPKIVIFCLQKITEQAFFNLAPSLLHKAAIHGHNKVLKLLLDIKLEHRANINSLNAQQLTPLHVCCSEGHVDCVAFLLSRGASVNEVDFDNRTPLYFAAHNGHLECVEEVLKCGGDVHKPRHGGWYPLHEAARFGYFRCMKKLIKAGSDIHATTDDARWTPGHMAASNGQLSCLQYLIQAGIDVNAKGGPDHASTLLHEAAHVGHCECVKLLLASGANAFALNGRGEVAIHLATRQGHDKTVELLLQYYNKLNRADMVDCFPTSPEDREIIVSRNNCLHSASYHGHERCIEVLLKYGAMHLMNGAEMYPVHIASKQKNVASLRIMLAHGGNSILSVLSGNDYNALQYLCMGTHSMDKKAMACACILLNSGIDANRTPTFDDRLCSLYLATRNGAKELVQQLLATGVSPYIELNFNERLLANPRVAQSVDIVHDYIDKPLSLLLSSRISIRRLFQKGRMVDVFQLPLPSVLQHFVFHGHGQTDGLCDP